MALKTPYYVIVGIRPIKAIKTPDGGLGVYIFNWQTGDFDLDMSYLNRIYGGRPGGADDEFEELSEVQFEVYVQKLRKERGLHEDY